tara:strand:- start:1164 stop:1409 length:246 start_codon:yes stop_codon:yes gene_type:complete
MRLNDPHHLQVQDIDSLQASELAMAFINDNLIQPMIERDLLDNDQLRMLGTIGGALKVLAQKAHSYERLYENNTNAHNLNN